MQQLVRSICRPTGAIGKQLGSKSNSLRSLRSTTLCPGCNNLQVRHLFDFSKKEDKVPEPNFPWFSEEERGRYIEVPKPEIPILANNNLFHPLSKSPLPSMRAMGRRINEQAFCPHGVKHEVGKHRVTFECPDCGIPTYCSKEHWEADYHNHVLVCDTLREINEDEHDLRSERDFPEFKYAGEGWNDDVINMTSWDAFLYTREFIAHDEERMLRHATRLLTYPVTIGSVIHMLSPYTLKSGRLTYEGLKSFSATRYTLHPTPQGWEHTIKDVKPIPPPVRLFIIGARAEASLPRDVWVQLSYLFPFSWFHLIFIGPEAYKDRPAGLPWPPPPRAPENPYGQLVERPMHRMKISTITETYDVLHKSGYFRPYDPYFDVFVLFHPGFGHPASGGSWDDTIHMLLETKCPIIATGYHEEDMERDIEWVKEKTNGEFDTLLTPGENIFKSLRWDLDEHDPAGGLTQGNYGVWAFRGKRYETSKYIDTPEVINL